MHRKSNSRPGTATRLRFRPITQKASMGSCVINMQAAGSRAA